MLRYFIALVLCLLVLAVPTVANAQNVNGDYFKEDIPIVDGDYLLSSWRVASSSLNCRNGAGTNYEVLQKFTKDDLLEARTSYGRMSNVDPIHLDCRGLPWMHLTTGYGDCFVRSNSQYIAPRRNP
jgi:hypothetical protein